MHPLHHNLYLPDSLQIACAISSGCEAILTNDRKYQRVTELQVLALDQVTP